MSSIWQLSEQTVVNLLEMVQDLGDRELKELLERALDYIYLHDKRKFSWKSIQEIEKKVATAKGERFMPFRYHLKKGRREIALQMLKDNADIRMICRYTKLSLEEVEKLRAQLET